MQEGKKQNPLMQLFRMSWQHSPKKANIVWYWIMFFMANIFSIIAAPLALARVMDTVQKEGVTKGNFGGIVLLLGSLFLIDILFWAFHGPARLIEQTNAFGVRSNYRKFLIGGVISLPLSWHTEHHSGDTIDKVNKGTDAIFSFSEDSFEVIYSLVQLVGSFAMLAYFSPLSSIIVLTMFFTSMFITMRFDRTLIPQYKDLSKMENEITESTFDTISNITTLHILRAERRVFKSIMRKVEKPLELFKRNNLIGETKWCATSLCSTIMTAAVLVLYFWQHIDAPQGILLGSIYLLVKYLDKLSEVFFRFTGLYSTIVKQSARISNSELLSNDFKPESMTNHGLPPDWKKLEINNLDFSYHSGESADLHLNGVSLTLHRGERIAFVGASGGGKTTALKLIRGVHTPQQLDLLVDGKRLPEGFDGISQAIALVPQSPEIFASTVLNNITLWADYPAELIRRYMDVACFSEVVPSLPKGLESSTKEKGVNLSAGQNQRLALARALLACHEKDIVLLDEPTSSLDKGTELSVYRNIFAAFSDKTVVSSIHQLHLLSLFDRICMFDKGKIVGEGTLADLLATCPEFQTLWERYNQKLAREQKIAPEEVLVPA